MRLLERPPPSFDRHEGIGDDIAVDGVGQPPGGVEELDRRFEEERRDWGRRCEGSGARGKRKRGVTRTDRGLIREVTVSSTGSKNVDERSSARSIRLRTRR